MLLRLLSVTILALTLVACASDRFNGPTEPCPTCQGTGRTSVGRCAICGGSGRLMSRKDEGGMNCPDCRGTGAVVTGLDTDRRVCESCRGTGSRR